MIVRPKEARHHENIGTISRNVTNYTSDFEMRGSQGDYMEMCKTICHCDRQTERYHSKLARYMLAQVTEDSDDG